MSAATQGPVKTEINQSNVDAKFNIILEKHCQHLKQKADEAKRKEKEEEEAAALDIIEKFKVEIGDEAFSDLDIDLDLQQSLQPFSSTPTNTCSKAANFPNLSTSIMACSLAMDHSVKGQSRETPNVSVTPPNEQELETMSDLEILKHPAIFSAFIRLVGLDEAVIHLRVVACFMKYTNIDIEKKDKVYDSTQAYKMETAQNTASNMDEIDSTSV